MSHIVTIATEVRDPDAVAAACRRLGLPEPVQGTASLFEGQATGLLVRLPGWLYPVVCDTDDRCGSLRQLQPAMGQTGTARPAAPGLRGGKGPHRSPQARPPGRRTVPGRRLDPAHHPGRRCRLKTIEITVDPKGQSKVETKGFTGGECREASRFVEQALGTRSAETLTAEYHQGQEVGEHLPSRSEPRPSPFPSPRSRAMPEPTIFPATRALLERPS